MGNTADIDIENKMLWRRDNPIAWGIAASVLIVATMIGLAFVETCTSEFLSTEVCSPKWLLFINSTPNEIGDTLAGFAGALAFIWIIATVWLQSTELSEQRKELKLQRIEFEAQRKATEEMARALGAQAVIFEDEKRQRKEGRAKEFLDSLLSSLIETFGEFDMGQSSGWKYFLPNPDGGGRKGCLHILTYAHQDHTTDQNIQEFGIRLERTLEDLKKMDAKNALLSFPNFDERPIKLITSLEQIASLKTRLSEAEQERLKRLYIERSIDLLIEICSELYWGRTVTPPEVTT